MCSQCEKEIKSGAKFCAFCGKPAPQKTQSSTTHLTTTEVYEWLADQGSEIDEDLYFVERPVNERTQGVLVFVSVDDDGDTAYDSVHMWSSFASTKVNSKRALDAVTSLASWGMIVRGDDLQLRNLLFVESLTSIHDFERYVDWLAIQADKIEETLTGKDTF